MGSHFLIVHVLILVFLSFVTGQPCQGLDVKSELMDAAIHVTAKDGQNIYEIAAGKDGGMGVSLLPVNSTSCPAGCVYELLSYVSPRNDSVLHVQGQPHPLFVPLGYNMAQNTNERLVCAMQESFCGATVPLYRHYKVDFGGILHAYSFDQDPIPGYTREWLPMCYGWTAAGSAEIGGTGVTAAHSTPSHLQ